MWNKILFIKNSRNSALDKSHNTRNLWNCKEKFRIRRLRQQNESSLFVVTLANDVLWKLFLHLLQSSLLFYVQHSLMSFRNSAMASFIDSLCPTWSHDQPFTRNFSTFLKLPFNLVKLSPTDCGWLPLFLLQLHKSVIGKLSPSKFLYVSSRWQYFLLSAFNNCISRSLCQDFSSHHEASTQIISWQKIETNDETLISRPSQKENFLKYFFWIVFAVISFILLQS